MISPSRKKRWNIAPPIPEEIKNNLSSFNNPVLQQILYNRGFHNYENALNFLDARLPDGSESSNISGMPAAIERIEWALRHDETIAVYGDYDVDGVTATALLWQDLTARGARVQGYIPNRFDEGYGLNIEALDNLYAQGVRLVITVDCGIRSIAEASHAQNIGMDMIISDHHHPATELPQATAIINPKQPQDEYPYKDLAGVGLAYKIVQALSAKMNQAYGLPSDFDPYLDLVALGTVADLAPLTGENRYLVRHGLEYLRQPHRQGLMALIGVSGLLPRQITASQIGFVLGPRLNAAGRLESALDALNLLITSDVREAARLAQQLEIQNRERQQITTAIQQHAEQQVLQTDPEATLFFAADPSYNPGVVGLAASKLSEQYYRPAIVAYRGDEFTRGSCRSIPEFHITQALDQCADLLVHHGGHAAAAGFTIRNEDVPEFVDRMRQIAVDELGKLDLRQTLPVDLEIPLSKLKPELLGILEMLQPTGYGNRQAYFVSRELKPRGVRAIGREGAHLKFSATDGWITFDAIAFRQGYWYDQMPSRIDILYTFEVNEYNGIKSLQLNVKDIKPSGEAD
jgi:single-stranded-DNA-specific exonuclease